MRAGSFLGLQVLILQMVDGPVLEELAETHVCEDIAAPRKLLLNPVLFQQADQCELLQYFLRVRPQRLLQQCITLRIPIGYPISEHIFGFDIDMMHLFSNPFNEVTRSHEHYFILYFSEALQEGCLVGQFPRVNGRLLTHHVVVHRL